MRGDPKVLKNAKALRRSSTDAELALWNALRRRQLSGRFRRQFPIPPYIVDFACIEACLVVEADGGQHAEPEADTTRDAILRAKGWRILRFWNNEIFENRDGVLLSITQALQKPPP